MKSFTKKKLAKEIFQRTSGAIPQKNLDDCVQVICEYLIEAAADNRAVSIVNFGTFSPYTQAAHVGLNISSGELHQVQAQRSLKFRPHVALTRLLNKRRDKFS